MEVEVQSPSRSPTMDNFDFIGARSSPYLSAPSSPKRFGEHYLSAPTSPSRLSEFYTEFDYFSTAATNNGIGDDDDGFAFYVSLESDKSSRSAEELFDGGKIKSLKPEGEGNELFKYPKSPLLSQKKPNRSSTAEGTKVIRQAFSLKKKKESHSGDPFATSIETEERRGRDRTPAATAALSSSNSGRRVTRSHSPYRIPRYTWDEEHHPQQQTQSNKEESTSSSNSRASLSSTSSSSKSYRRWRLRDLLLFRSASEGRGYSKEPLKGYSVLYKKPEEVKSSSFRSSDNPTSAPGSRRKGPASAHELHYAMKKAESEDLKKRTFLPYKQGILGRLAGLGSLTR